MRFHSLNKPPTVSSWRIILWMITLVPMMLMASWFARRGQLSQSANGVSGLTKEDARRLDRILHSANETTEAITVGKSRHDTNSSRNGTDLASVSDNTFGIPNVERAAYEALLNQASGANQADLERTSHRDVPFAILMLEPDRFRGELITINGDLRRLHRIANVGNDNVSIDATKPETYEAWIFTTDSGLNPYRVVCTSLPTGLAFGDQLTRPIRVRATGYFFKRYSYATTGNYHTAPLLLAKSLVQLVPPKPSAQSPDHSARTLAIIAVCLFLVITIGGILVGVSVRRPKRNLDDVTFAEPTELK